MQMEKADVRHYMVILPNEFSKIKVTLKKILAQVSEALQQVIIYVSTKEIGYLLYKSLNGAHCEAAEIIHGDLTQQDRQKVQDSFNRKDTRFLITTDVYATGFDHSEVNLVINHFLPLKRDPSSSSSSEDPEIDTNVYLQRFYSCPNGAVFNLLCGDTDDDKIMRKLERVLKQEVTRLPFWRNTEDYEVALREAGLG